MGRYYFTNSSDLSSLIEPMKTMFSFSGIFMLTKSAIFGTNHHKDRNKDISGVRIIRDSPLLFNV